VIRELVLARLSQPESKRATVETLARQAGITLNLDRVCQSMDSLDAPVIDRICQMSRQAAETLLGGPVDVLFCDCTTLAFETEREDAPTEVSGQQTDHLLAKGFSKDGRTLSICSYTYESADPCPQGCPHARQGHREAAREDQAQRQTVQLQQPWTWPLSVLSGGRQSHP